MKRKTTFFDNFSFEFDGCFGCALHEFYKSGKLSVPAVYSGEYCWVHQDPQNAVPGFFIISPYRHVVGIADLTPEEYAELSMLILRVRGGMREILKALCVNIYQEEAEASHLHVWLLPIWNNQGNIETAKSNVMDYLKQFSYDAHGKEVARCAGLMKEYLLDV
jgi:diadenosine tetraphosphate (Ap4A) HIT family hydrolase